MSDKGRTNLGLWTLFTLAMLGIWLPIMGLAILLLGRGNSLGDAYAFAFAIILFGIIEALAILLFIVYAVLARPWKKPGKERWLFILHAWIAGIVLVVGGGFFGQIELGAYQQEQSVKQQDHWNRINESLRSDDPLAFENELKACGSQCNDPWIEEAVDLRAPKSLALQLRSLDKAKYQALYAKPSNKSGCQNAALFDMSLPLAGLAGMRYKPDVIKLLQPYWAQADLNAALWGATAGDHVAGMQALVDAGADIHSLDPAKPQSGKDLVWVATRRGAVGALKWLAQQGVRVDQSHADGSPGDLVKALVDWSDQTSVAIYQTKVDELVETLAGMGAQLAPAGGGPLRTVLEEQKVRLAKALIHHGADPAALAPDQRAKLTQLLTQPDDQDALSIDDFHLKCNPFGVNDASEQGTDR
jgi:hypothetical protein